MFDSLSEKLEQTFKRLSGRGTISESDVDEVLREIRIALLEADVNVKVAKDFCTAVREKAIKEKLHKSLNPSQIVIKSVHDELIKAMGTQAPLNLRHAPPVIIMLVGLQGSGKTTSCGKLARYLRDEQRRRPLLVPADIYRPAAIEQLKRLGRDLKIEVFDSNAGQKPVEIAQLAVAQAQATGLDTLILDTAGRLQIDRELMNELADIVETVEPHEILLVVDAMTGQEAVNVAKGFDEVLDLDGMVLTKLDGDARGGAALSMRAVTGKSIKFIGVGEKLDALEPFYPDRMASRILGMGDVLSLIEKATKQVSIEDAQKLQKKIRKDQFSLEDFLGQLQTIRKMGSFGSMMQMIPGLGKLAKGVDEEQAEGQFKRIEAMILSMTRTERQAADIINGSRRKRIAEGSGTTVEEVNKFLKQFEEIKKMMKKMTKMGPSMLRGMGSLGNFASFAKGGLKPPLG